MAFPSDSLILDLTILRMSGCVPYFNDHDNNDHDPHGYDHKTATGEYVRLGDWESSVFVEENG